MSGNKFFRITVEGRGRFPIDMLRHDQCFPLSEMDSAEIVKTTAKRTIELGCSTKRHIFGVATDNRWSSFGWKVLKVDEI